MNLCCTIVGQGYSTIHANAPKSELQAIIQLGCGPTTLLRARIPPWNLKHVLELYAITAKFYYAALDKGNSGGVEKLHEICSLTVRFVRSFREWISFTSYGGGPHHLGIS